MAVSEKLLWLLAHKLRLLILHQALGILNELLLAGFAQDAVEPLNSFLLIAFQELNEIFCILVSLVESLYLSYFRVSEISLEEELLGIEIVALNPHGFLLQLLDLSSGQLFEFLIGKVSI